MRSLIRLLALLALVGGVFAFDVSERVASAQPAGTGCAYFYSPIDCGTGRIGDERMRQAATQHLMTRILLGGTEQINCGSCVSGFGAIGSGAFGFHGRYALSDRLALMGGVSINEYRAGGVTTTNSVIGAASLRYDLTDWGWSRPFFELGGSLAPHERHRFARAFDWYGSPRIGIGRATGQSQSAFVRTGWVWRVSPRDELSVYGDLSRQWLRSGAYTESALNNPQPVTFYAGTDMLNVVRMTAQWTRLLTPNIEGLIGLTAAQSFNNVSGVRGVIVGTYFRTMAPNPAWFEYTARLGYRLSKGVVIDAFVIGTAGEKPIGYTVHGGLGVRYTF